MHKVSKFSHTHMHTFHTRSPKYECILLKLAEQIQIIKYAYFYINSLTPIPKWGGVMCTNVLTLQSTKQTNQTNQTNQATN